MNKEKIIAFDLDGTLIDSAPDIAYALNKILKKNELKYAPLKEIRKLIGNGAKALLINSFKQQNIEPKNIDRLTKEFLYQYRLCFKNKTKLFKNVKQTLKKLKKNKINLILVSNKPEYYVKELLKHFKLDELFSSFSGGDTFSFRKPDPRHIFQSIANANINGNYNGIFVGDSKYDVECAKNANWPCVLFTKGYSEVDINKLGPSCIFEDFKELPIIINNIFDNFP